MILRPAEVEASWYGRIRLGFLKRTLLQLLALLYAMATCLRRSLYAMGILTPTRLPVPVVVVGNIIVGGAGKTPLTRALALQLQASGWHPGIISRGYGRSVPGVRAVAPDESPAQVGDEPLLYAQDAFPVYVGENRVAAGRALLAANPSVDILIADDGLQHYALARDLELVVFDSRGIGNGRLLPAGPLREAVRRLQEPKVKGLVWQGGVQPLAGLAGRTLPTFTMTLVPGAVYGINDRSRRCPLDAFAGQSVSAVAGIGHPERFFQMLRDQGLQVESLPFADHHRFTESDMPVTTNPVLMTEKDAVKCRQFSAGHDNWFVVPVNAQIAPSLPLHEWLSDHSPKMENR